MVSIWAVARTLALRHFRGPLLPLAALLFGIICSAIPISGSSGSVMRPRSLASVYLGTGGMVLLLLALVLPWSSLLVRFRLLPGGRLSMRGGQGASLLAHALFLVLAGCLLGFVTQAILSLRVGGGDFQNGTPVLRRVLDSAPKDAFALSKAKSAKEITVDLSGLDSATHEILLRLAPVLLIDPHAGLPTQGARSCSLNVAWRLGNEGPFRRQEVKVYLARAELVMLKLPKDAGSRKLTLGIEVLGEGFIPQFRPGSITFLGRPQRMVTSVLRGFLVQAFLACALMALCLWFSGFVSYPLAIAACLTVTFVWGAAGSLLPSALPADPAVSVGLGYAVAWSDVWLAALVAAVSCAAVVLLPFSEPRIGVRS